MDLADEVRRIVAADPSALNQRQSRNENNRTPLHFAVARNRAEMVALLLTLGADPLAVDGGGMPVAVYAADREIDLPVMTRIHELTLAEMDGAARGRRAHASRGAHCVEGPRGNADRRHERAGARRPDGTLGPNVKPWDGTCRGVKPPDEEDEPTRARCPSGYLPGGMFLESVTMYSVAGMLSLPQSRELLGALAADQTGLTGRYTLDLKFTFPPRAATAAPVDVGPSLSTAVREQWGVRIERGKAPFKLVVIEHAQPPVEN